MAQLILARLRQRTTWLALSALAGLLGVQLAPDVWERIIVTATTLADAVSLLLPLLGQ